MVSPWVRKRTVILGMVIYILLLMHFGSKILPTSFTFFFFSVYSSKVHFFRLLHLLSNDIMLKAKDTIGNQVLEDPERSLANIKLALRVCAEFRGCYLDFREKSDAIVKKLKEEKRRTIEEGVAEHQQ